MQTTCEPPEETPYYPLFVSLQGRVCLVVGGGTVGERKVKGLLRCGASIRLVARELTPWLEQQCKGGRLRQTGKEYGEAALDGVDLAFAATSDAAVNRTVAEDARRRGLWCNVATDPEQGSFIVPSVLQRGPLMLAISTAGLSPALAKRIRERLEEEFGVEWVVTLRLMGLLRRSIQAKGLGTADNQRLFRALANLPAPEWIAQDDSDRLLRSIHEICRPWLSLEEVNHMWKEAWTRSSLS